MWKGSERQIDSNVNVMAEANMQKGTQRAKLDGEEMVLTKARAS
jgi:hypothetical protein